MIDDSGFTRLLLERLKLQIGEIVSYEVLERSSLEVEHLADVFARGVALKLRTEVLAERVGRQTARGTSSVTFTMPATWWQHWKQAHRTRWYARWLIRWRPIELRTITRQAQTEVDVEQFRAFPQARIRYPDNMGRIVQLLIPSPVRWAWDDPTDAETPWRS